MNDTTATQIANAVGQVKSGIEQIIDRNPDLPVVVRRRLMAQVMKLEALASIEQVQRLDAACTPADEESLEDLVDRHLVITD